jgi:hypothetical protein
MSERIIKQKDIRIGDKIRVEWPSKLIGAIDVLDARKKVYMESDLND